MWPTDRWRRHQNSAAPDSALINVSEHDSRFNLKRSCSEAGPVVTRSHDGRRWVIGAADIAAQRLGLRAGLPLAQAQAMRPGLCVIDADPAGDAADLRDLAVWCQRYAPLTAADPPDGIRIDTTGADHLQGGEAAMLADLRDRLARSGFTARAAVADTPGAAWALARHGLVQPGDRPLIVVPPGGVAAALAPLAVVALRLPADTVTALDRLGFSRIGQLADAPRGPLARRFGAGLLRQLDHAYGTVFEPLEPVPPPTLIRQRLTFVEPLSTAEAFAAVIARLCRTVCAAMERRGEGARRLDLVCERVDGTLQLVAVGTARPVRDPVHLARLLAERIETIDPGLGVEAMTLWVPLAEAAPAGQGDVLAPGGGDLGPLIDRLVARFGAAQVYRAAPVESDVPERSVARLAGLSPAPLDASLGRSWPQARPRPLRLLTPPQPVQAIALLPDQPPVAFIWRRVRHRVRRADGPERIFGEWWRRDGEMRAVRDYWAVEDEAGERFWLYRSGDGVEPETGNLAWFLHGIF
jgi:protein ImuB